MKPILLFTLLSLSSLFSNAQFVTIPDSNFVSYLQSTFPSAMNGNQMDTTDKAITTAIFLDCSSLGITNLYGVEFFDTLWSLQCADNQLTSLPNLPSLLGRLYCYNNKLTTLSNLPVWLEALFCNNNGITQLPDLPIYLRWLICDNNQLTSLPALPTTLIELRCDWNLLTSIPSLPSSIQKLICHNNQISQLPSLPNSLLELWCGSNQISQLPSLPNGLTSLQCDNNVLTSLPTLPNTISGLQCDNNLLTSLPSLPNALFEFSCSHNKLTDIPDLPSSLGIFSCRSNLITQLPLLPNSLQALYANDNRLVSLPNLPSSLYIFSCIDNPELTCLPSFSQDTFWFFEVRKNTQIKCLPRTVTVGWHGDSSAFLPICNTLSGCAISRRINGNVYRDASFNCTPDSLNNGPVLSGVKLLQYINGEIKGQTYTDKNGHYSFGGSSGDSIVVQMDPENYFLETCPLSGKISVELTDLDSQYLNQDFGVKCLGSDIGVWSIQGTFRPSRNRAVYIKAGDVRHQFNMKCTDSENVTVTTTINGDAVYVRPLTGALTPSSIDGKTLYYTISDIGSINPDSAFNILVRTNASATAGNEICIKTVIKTSVNDLNPLNDSLEYCGVVVNSYDPNDKTAYPRDKTTPDSWITYTIRFQNTGTDTAYHIAIRDTLSSYLDESTFTYLNGSVRPIISITENAVLFNYPHINLLDSFHNEPESHGWVQYKVKTIENLPHLATITNKAYIYFDLNSAVVTNTTINDYDFRSSQNITSCDSANIFGQIYYNSQIIVDTITDNNNVSSIVTTDLVINKSSSTSENITACDSIIYQGETFYTSLTLSDTFSTILGCDSIVNTNLVIQEIDVQTTLKDATITCAQEDALYQWLDCNSGYGILAKATNQSLTPIRNGDYAVEVSINGCLDTSLCVNINTLNVRENSLDKLFKIYPNPSSMELNIITELNLLGSDFRILNSLGQEVILGELTNSMSKIDLSQLPKGSYHLHINKGIYKYKLLIQ
ncbi:MAG: T9SS type A sorting domain-containing protein [Bacteroidia bacterium]